MVVNEEILSAFRGKDGSCSVSGQLMNWTNRLQISSDLFTSTDQQFRSDWQKWQGVGNYNDQKQKLDVVVLLAFTRSVPVLARDREWLALDHQAGGYSCEHVRMIGTRLKPRPGVLAAFRKIARDGFYAETGHFNKADLLASRIAGYVSALAEIGVDCECSWRHLTESLYPIDATQANLDKIAEDAPNLDLISDWGGHIRARYSDDPAIFFLTENSD